MFLAATDRSIKIKSDATATTTEPQVAAGFVDTETTAFTPGEKLTNLTGNTAVKVVDEPVSSSIQRHIKSINVFNADTVSHDITVSYFDNLDEFVLGIFTVPTLKTLLYTYEQGWTISS